MKKNINNPLKSLRDGTLFSLSGRGRGRGLIVALCIPILFNSCQTGRNTKNTDNMQKKSEFRVAQYNIRSAAPADEESGNGWSLRKEPLSQVILSYNFDIVGTQEGNDDQIPELQALLPDYSCEAYPYGGKNGDMHNCAIFYKTDKFKMLAHGVFWLSETPDVKSIGWDATDIRICNWAKFKEKASGKVFYFFNVHFYPRNTTAKQESGTLMVKKIQEIAGQTPVICVGDFNSKPDTPQMIAVKNLLSDAFDITQTPRQGPENTSFHGGEFTGTPRSRIDYILVSKHFKVLSYNVLTDSYNDGHYPSDHLPVVCTVVL